MDGFFQQCLETHEKLCKSNGHIPTKKNNVTHPSIDDHQIPPEDFENPGKLSKDAAKIVMKLLYGCRFVRFDYLWPCGDLARRITKWTKACDRRLDRLMDHLRCTQNFALEGFMGDAADQCHVLAYCDASFADDLQTSKSTSGLFIAIVGPNTFVPITNFAKRQASVSHSTTESEMVSLEEGLRSEALPIITFWEHVTQLFSDPLPNTGDTASQSWQAGRHSNSNEVDATDINENDETNQMVISQAPLTKTCAPTGGVKDHLLGGERVHKNSMAESVTMDMGATTKRPAKHPLQPIQPTVFSSTPPTRLGGRGRLSILKVLKMVVTWSLPSRATWMMLSRGARTTSLLRRIRSRMNDSPRRFCTSVV